MHVRILVGLQRHKVMFKMFNVEYIHRLLCYMQRALQASNWAV